MHVPLLHGIATRPRSPLGIARLSIFVLYRLAAALNHTHAGSRA